MMNSTANDEFGDNPFRSSATGGADSFFDAPPTQTQFQQPPPQQQFVPQGNMYAQPPPVQQNFASPQMSGTMGTMNNGSQMQSQMQPPPPPRGCWGTVKMLFDLNTYKAYFDVDADDIVTRLKAVCLDFAKPEHFRNNVLGSQQTNGLKGPDLYGPYWVTMSLIFLVGVTSNMHDYLHRSDIQVFEYDINHLLHAGSIFSSFAFGLPSVIWVTTKFMKTEALSLVEWQCMYGYSLVPFIPAALLCVIPLGFLSWIFLAIATVMSCSLVVRNVSAPLLATDSGQTKAPPVILAILAAHVIFFFVVKFTFYHHKK